MHEFRKILFPVDLSETSPHISAYVRLMATQFEAEIHLLFVARVFGYFSGIYVPHPSIDTFEREIVAGAGKRLDEFRSEFFAAFQKVQAAVVAGRRLGGNSRLHRCPGHRPFDHGHPWPEGIGKSAVWIRRRTSSKILTGAGSGD